MTAGRELTRREREVLLAMINHASEFDADSAPIDSAQRARWRGQAAGARAYGSCGCGTCPSIELGDSVRAAPTEGPRRVLSAHRGDETLLLFIDNDRPSYLEQFSTREDLRFDEFPDPAELTY